MQSEDNLILASRTASGKTEAAFLPILSRVNFNDPGVQVLYISPLIALINDQFIRVQELCEHLDVPVTKWHGEASQTLKNKLVSDPRGVVLITPESIEAMLVNSEYKAKGLFSNLKFIVIDEIHAFLGTDRGKQLQSLIFRLRQFNTGNVRVIGLSATIGSFEQAKEMVGPADSTRILRDTTGKEIETEFKYFEQGNLTELPLALLKDLYLSVCNNKVLIFPNARGTAEEVAVKLHKISQKVGGHPYYFSHHSSVHKELREYIEAFAKNNVRYPFAIACTSTLELGIDIGSVDKVVQINATHSIAGLIQRIGRSGRRNDETSKLSLYATDPWNLLQAIACMTLFKREGFVEPIEYTERPYDILLHQALAMVRQVSECTQEELIHTLSINSSFKYIPPDEMKEIVLHLQQTDLLELIGGKLIIGVEGEKIVNTKDFYSVFQTEPLFKVQVQDKPIGEIPYSYLTRVDQNILLAARIWKIIDIDLRAKRITVIPAMDGKKPVFAGAGHGEVHPRIRQEMLRLLVTDAEMPRLSEDAAEAIRQLKLDFEHYKIEDFQVDRPLRVQVKDMYWYSFHGTRVNESLSFLFDIACIAHEWRDLESKFKFDAGDFELIIQKAMKAYDDLEPYLVSAVEHNPALLAFSKFGAYLPLKYQVHLVRDKRFDFAGAMDFLSTVHTSSIHTLPDS
jgi:ATP-dependent Lhr-like helicase